MIPFQEILSKSSSLFDGSQVGPNPSISQVLPPENSSSQSLAFVSTREQLNVAKASSCIAIIGHTSIKEDLTKLDSSFAWACAPSIPLAMAAVLRLFDTKAQQYPTGINSMASVSATAKLGAKVSIGPFTLIGNNVQIGDNTLIGSGVTIEDNAKIGANCIIHAGVVIAHSCVIGQHCEIHSNSVIGSDGYGYATDKNRVHHKIPQIGNVILEDFVEVGANSAIDRATLTSTKIGAHTKIDNLCHIAHNCEIGKGCFITANFAIAGSSKIGDYFVCGGSTSIGDHVNIPSGVQLAGATVVTSSLEHSGAYGGNPVEPMKDYLKTRANIFQLTRLRRQMAKVLKHLNIED